MARCRAKTREGDQCRNNAIPGTKYCYIASHGAIGAPFYKRCLNFARNHLVLTIIGLIVGLVPFFWHYRDVGLAATSGLISHPHPASQQVISIGAARTVIDAPDGVIFRDGSDRVLSVRMIANKLYVSALIRDEKGDLVAELRDNEWSLNKNEYYDRNYNDQAIEVRDNSGDIVLQVVDFGDTIHLSSVFHCKGDFTTILAPVDEHSGAIDFLLPGEQPHYRIQPICEYPSNTHLGQCPEIESLGKIVQNGRGCEVRLGGSTLPLCGKHGRIMIGDCTKF